MSVSFSELLGSITAKCEILSRRCNDLEVKNHELQARVSEAERELAVARQELDAAQRRLEYQTIAANFDSGTRDTSRQSSKIISDLVRKIDRCISRLEAE